MSSNVASQALLKPTSEHGRNVFALDNRHVYSQKAGQIVPVKAFHYEPGTHFDIQAHDFTLTFPMQTAPFLRGRKEFAFYSVYYNAVWSLFNQYQSTREDPKTSAFGSNVNLTEPRIYLDNIYTGILSQFFYYLVYQYFIPYIINHDSDASVVANADLIINEARNAFLDTVILSGNATPFEISFAYTYVGVEPVTFSFDFNFPYPYTYDSLDMMVGNGSREDANRIWTAGDYAVRDWCCDIVGHLRVFNWIRKLDMLGYGNIYPMIRNFENTVITLMDSNDPETFWQQWPSLSSDLATRLIRTVVVDPSVDFSNWTRKAVNLYPICAYNAVFYHFFRNSYYDNTYYSHDFNLDFVSVESATYGSYNVVGLRDFSTRFLDIEYHQWKKDTFTAVLPDQQFGAVSSISLSGVSSSDLGRWQFSNMNPITSNSYAMVNLNGNLGSSSIGDPDAQSELMHNHSISSSFDVIALKRAEMLQEYRQQLMRAGNRTSDVFRALYGRAASSEHEDDVIPRFLDTFGEDIFVDPVQSTANTGSDNPNGQLGDIAARGKFRGDSGHIKFNAGGNFGLILCLSYVVPTAEYNSYMFDKHIFELTPEDHFIPQFENLGLEPLYLDELNSLKFASNNVVLGYVPRYHHKKQEVDMVHGAFVSFYGRSGLPTGLSNQSPFSVFGDFNNWVSPRTDLQCRDVTLKRDFYINPSVLDNIFVRAAGADFSDDQFICTTFFECNAVKEMSKIGLINFV